MNQIFDEKHLLKDTSASAFRRTARGNVTKVCCNMLNVEKMTYPTGAVISNPVNLYCIEDKLK